MDGELRPLYVQATSAMLSSTARLQAALDEQYKSEAVEWDATGTFSLIDALEQLLIERGERRPVHLRCTLGRFMTRAESEPKLAVLAQTLRQRDAAPSGANQLRALTVSSPALTGQLLAAVASAHGGVSALDCSHSPLGGGVAALAGRLPQLRTLHLTACQLTAADVEQLADAFRSGAAAGLDELSLARNELAGEALAPLLRELATAGLRTLDLSDNALCAAACTLLAAALRPGGAPLAALNLSGSRFGAQHGDAAATLLRAALACPSLTVLRADYCALDDSHAVAAVAADSALTELSLCGNALSAVGAAALAGAVAGQRIRLTAVDLSHNPIGDALFADWLPLLARPACTLASVRLLGCDVTAPAGDWLSSLAANGALLTLAVDAHLLTLCGGARGPAKLAAITARNAHNRELRRQTLFDRACRRLTASHAVDLPRLSTQLCRAVANSLRAQLHWEHLRTELDISEQLAM